MVPGDVVLEEVDTAGFLRPSLEMGMLLLLSFCQAVRKTIQVQGERI